MTILIFLFSILFFTLAWRRLEWAVLLMIAALPSYLIRFSVGVPMTLLELMILISFFVWLITKTNLKLFFRGKYGWKDFKENRLKREKYPWRWEIIALLIISWVAIAVGGFTNGALGIWKAYFFEPILIFILLLNLSSRAERREARDPLNVKDEKYKGFLSRSLRGRNDIKNVGLNLEKIIFALAVSAFVVSVLAIYQKLTGNLIDNPFWSAAATRRAVSFFGYPNAVGLYLGPIVVIILGYIFQLFVDKKLPRNNSQGDKISKSKFPMSNKDQNPNDKKFGNLIFGFDWKLEIGNWKLKVLFIAFTIFISLLSIVFAKSEGAIIGLAAAFFVFGILAGKKLRWATIILTIICGGAILSYTPTRTLALDKIQLHDLSGQIRRQQWKETWRMLNDGRLLLGAGLDNYQKTIKPYHQEGIFVYDWHDPNFHAKLVASDELKKKVWQPTEIYMYPHNILLNFWSELGLVGMILFLWIIMKFLWLGIFNFQPCLPAGRFSIFKTNKDYINLGLLCAMVVIVIHGLVDVPYFKNDLAVMFWVMLTMMSLIDSGNRKQKEN